MFCSSERHHDLPRGAEDPGAGRESGQHTGPQPDDWVDRPEVEEAQVLDLTGTNRPRI